MLPFLVPCKLAVSPLFMSDKHQTKLINRVHSAFSRGDLGGLPPKSTASAPVSSRSLFSRPKLHKNAPPALDLLSSSDIFERSILAALFLPPISAASALNSQSAASHKHLVAHSARSRSLSVVSASSQASQTPYAIPVHHNTEDFIAPVLDTTTEVLSDPSIDINDIEIVCPCDTDDDEDHECTNVRPLMLRSRSRSRSIISSSLRQCINGNGGANGTLAQSGSGSVSPTMSHVRLSLLIANRNTSFASLGDRADLSPSKTTINFYSFADMVNTENHLANLLIGPSAYDDTLQEEAPLYEAANEDEPLGESKSQSIEKFYGFKLGSPPNKFHRTRSHGSNTLGIEPNDLRLGFQSMSMKEYISSVPQ